LKKGKEKLLSLGVKQWIVFLLMGVCCLVIVFPTGKEEKETPGTENRSTGYFTGQEYAPAETGRTEDYTTQLEIRLTELLSCVEHVGKVKVMVTVGETGRKDILQDGSHATEQKTEMDSAGGSRISVSEKSEGTTVFYDIDGGTTPYILSETYPEITGVLVIAEGSGTGTVDLDILNAVQVLFDIPAHKIKIMKMK
jgi:stage III sporulation protein AG